MDLLDSSLFLLNAIWFCQDKTRTATNPQIDALEDGYVDHELFSLAAIKVPHFFTPSVRE